MRSNIVLIGMPGVGKSTLGVVMAKIANLGFLDVDLAIQQQHGATLQRLIDDLGAEGFIACEGEALSGIDVEGCVIATGGSAVYSRDELAALGASGVVVYLEIPYETLLGRLGDLHERGVVMRAGCQAGLRGLYDERRPLYEEAADVVVNVDGLSITDAARKVLAEVSRFRDR